VHAIRVVTEAVKEVQEAAALAVNIAHNVDGTIKQLADEEHPLSRTTKITRPFSAACLQTDAFPVDDPSKNRGEVLRLG